MVTLYEDLKRLGFTAGSVNGLVYRGMAEHQIDLPQPLREFVPLDLPFQMKGLDFSDRRFEGLLTKYVAVGSCE